MASPRNDGFKLPMTAHELGDMIGGEKFRQESNGIAPAELYPRIELSSAEDGTLLKASRRGHHRFDLNAHVATTLISAQEILRLEMYRDPPTLGTSEREIEMVMSNNKYNIRKFCNNLPTSQDTGEDVFVMLIPLLSSSWTSPPLMKALLLVSEKTMCIVDVMDRDAVGFCISFLLENPCIVKCSIQASEDLPLLWTMFGCAPNKLFCITSAALKLLKHFGLDPKYHGVKTQNGRIYGLNFERFFGVEMEDVFVRSENALTDTKLLAAAKKNYQLMAFILQGVNLVSEISNFHWTEAFKWDSMDAIKQVEPFLTMELGVNFWKSLLMTMLNDLDLKIFIWSFVYQNFGALPRIGIPRDSAYNDVLPVYKKFVDVMQQGNARREGFTTDYAFMDEIAFSNYLANVLNGHAIVTWKTEVGTLGEMKRRLKLYLNWP